MAVPVLLLAGCLSSVAVASPEGGLTHRERLLGENESHFFRLITEDLNKGTYYEYFELQRVQSVSKKDLRVVLDTLLRHVRYTTRSVGSGVWEREELSTASFDLPAFERHHRMHLPFSETWLKDFVIDSAGVGAMLGRERKNLADRTELLRQLPGLEIRPAFGPHPKVVAIERTSAVGALERRMYFLIIRSGDDESERLLMVPQSKLR